MFYPTEAKSVKNIVKISSFLLKFYINLTWSDTSCFSSNGVVQDASQIYAKLKKNPNKRSNAQKIISASANMMSGIGFFPMYKQKLFQK